MDLVEGGASRVRLAVRTAPHIVRRSTAGWPAQAHRHPGPPTAGAAGRPGRPVDGQAQRARPVRTRAAAPGHGPLLTGQARAPSRSRTSASSTRSRGGRWCRWRRSTRSTRTQVVLADGTRITPDAVIAATGYRRGPGTAGRPPRRAGRPRPAGGARRPHPEAGTRALLHRLHQSHQRHVPRNGPGRTRRSPGSWRRTPAVSTPEPGRFRPSVTASRHAPSSLGPADLVAGARRRASTAVEALLASVGSYSVKTKYFQAPRVVALTVPPEGASTYEERMRIR